MNEHITHFVLHLRLHPEGTQSSRYLSGFESVTVQRYARRPPAGFSVNSGYCRIDRKLGEAMLRGLYVIVLAAGVVNLGRVATAYPNCAYGNKASYIGRVMTFCPQQEFPCCDEVEEMASKALFDSASTTELTGECAVYYKQVGSMFHTNCKRTIWRILRPAPSIEGDCGYPISCSTKHVLQLSEVVVSSSCIEEEYRLRNVNPRDTATLL